jgi:hypothetical protein
VQPSHQPLVRPQLYGKDHYDQRRKEDRHLRQARHRIGGRDHLRYLHLRLFSKYFLIGSPCRLSLPDRRGEDSVSMRVRQVSRLPQLGRLSFTTTSISSSSAQPRRPTFFCSRSFSLGTTSILDPHIVLLSIHCSHCPFVLVFFVFTSCSIQLDFLTALKLLDICGGHMLHQMT